MHSSLTALCVESEIPLSEEDAVKIVALPCYAKMLKKFVIDIRSIAVRTWEDEVANRLLSKIHTGTAMWVVLSKDNLEYDNLLQKVDCMVVKKMFNFFTSSPVVVDLTWWTQKPYRVDITSTSSKIVVLATYAPEEVISGGQVDVLIANTKEWRKNYYK